jgi:hypothetical protein
MAEKEESSSSIVPDQSLVVRRWSLANPRMAND